MRRLLCTVGLAATFAAAAGCGGGGKDRDARTATTPTAPAAWTAWTDRDARLGTQIPRGWHVGQLPVTSLSVPFERLIVSSFPIRQHTPDRGCGPETARRQMPLDGAMVLLMEMRGPTRSQLARTPARPARFRLPRSLFGPYECMGPSYALYFRDHRRQFLAQVYVGRRAPPATRRKVLGVLDRLRVGPPDPRSAAVWLAPSAVMRRAPYLGVACVRPNRFACDRVGLAVWLRHASESVTATVAGRSFALDDEAWSGSPFPDGRRRMFAGFLQPAGLVDGPLKVQADDGPGRWVGRKPVEAAVALMIRRSGDHYVRTSLVVHLAPGWG